MILGIQGRLYEQGETMTTKTTLGQLAEIADQIEATEATYTKRLDRIQAGVEAKAKAEALHEWPGVTKPRPDGRRSRPRRRLRISSRRPRVGRLPCGISKQKRGNTKRVMQILPKILANAKVLIWEGTQTVPDLPQILPRKAKPYCKPCGLVPSNSPDVPQI